MLGGEGVKTIQVCKYHTQSILQNKIQLGMKSSQALLNQIQNDNPDLKRPPALHWLALHTSFLPHERYKRQCQNQIGYF